MTNDAADATSPANSTRSFRRPHRQRQSKITDFFALVGTSNSVPQGQIVSSSSSQVSFLDLPRHIRERIYEEANIGGNKFIDLNFWTIEDGCLQDHNEQPLNWVPAPVADCSCANGHWSRFYEEPFPTALLRAGSRLIHDEVQAKLYAQNVFAVSLLGPNGLHPLEMLSHAALRELRVLIVSLRPCKCLTSFCSRIDWGYGECGVWPRPRGEYFSRALQSLSLRSTQHRRPLGCVSRTDKLTLARWQRICARLASSIRPRQLKLYLVAETADEQTANAILDPLRRMPVVKEAAIHLGTHLESIDFRSLARNTTLGLMKKLHYPPFRLMDLPLELQMNILKHTDLVAKLSMVWDPSERLRHQGSWRNCSGHIENSLDRAIFCSLEHSGTFSPRCQCRVSPLPYFLVSKAFAVIARSVFYASNEFKLLPCRWGLMDQIAGQVDAQEGDCCYELTLPSFLRHIPHEYTTHLTHLTLVLPPMAPTFHLRPGQDGGWGDWVAAVALLAQLADLSRLTLEVHFSDQNLLPYEPLAAADPDTLLHQSMRARKRRDAMLETAMLDTYRRVIEPLERLRPGLRALLVYVAWPLCKNAHEDRKANEKMLEEMIMGEGYDSAQWGKRDNSPYSQPERGY